MYLPCTIAVNSSIFLDYISFASHFPWSIFVFLYELNHFESGFQQWYASKRCTTQVSQRFMSTLMLLPIFLLYCSLVSRVLESHYSWSWVRNRWETATRKGQFMGVLFRKVSALQLPRTRVTGCEFQEKPEEVTKCAKSLLAMQTINLFNLHSPCSEPKRKKALNQK